jgi:hypothetical protein
LLLLILIAVRSSNAQDPTIGVAASVKPNAESVVGQTSQTLSPGSQLRSNETVRTGNRGQADLVFIDNTNLTVGPTSEVLLDKFVYDPVGSSGKVVMNATRGTFRFVTGKQDHRVYQVSTPYGTLGVRGTVAEIKILPRMVRKARPDECVATVRLVEGEITFTDNRGVVHVLNEVGTCGCLTADGRWIVSYCPSMFAAAAPPPPPPPPPGGGGCEPQHSPDRPC